MAREMKVEVFQESKNNWHWRIIGANGKELGVNTGTIARRARALEIVGKFGLPVVVRED